MKLHEGDYLSLLSWFPHPQSPLSNGERDKGFVKELLIN